MQEGPIKGFWVRIPFRFAGLLLQLREQKRKLAAELAEVKRQQQAEVDAQKAADKEAQEQEEHERAMEQLEEEALSGVTGGVIAKAGVHPLEGEEGTWLLAGQMSVCAFVQPDGALLIFC